MEPGGRKRSQSLGLRDHLQHAGIGIAVGHIMPGHIDGIILGDTGIFRFLELSVKGFFLLTLKRAVLHITDKSVFCADFLPVLLSLYDRDFITLADFC